MWHCKASDTLRIWHIGPRPYKGPHKRPGLVWLPQWQSFVALFQRLQGKGLANLLLWHCPSYQCATESIERSVYCLLLQSSKPASELHWWWCSGFFERNWGSAPVSQQTPLLPLFLLFTSCSVLSIAFIQRYDSSSSTLNKCFSCTLFGHWMKPPQPPFQKNLSEEPWVYTSICLSCDWYCWMVFSTIVLSVVKSMCSFELVFFMF